MSHYGFLSYVTFWVFELSHFEFLHIFYFVKFEFYQTFSFWVVTLNFFFSFVTIWVFEFCHILSFFLVLSNFKKKWWKKFEGKKVLGVKTFWWKKFSIEEEKILVKYFFSTVTTVTTITTFNHCHCHNFHNCNYCCIGRYVLGRV